MRLRGCHILSSQSKRCETFRIHRWFVDRFSEPVLTQKWDGPPSETCIVRKPGVMTDPHDIRVHLQFEEALKTAREIKAHAPHCPVIFTVNEMKRLGRDAAELTALADHPTAHGLVLEMPAGPLPGMYDPSGPSKLLFAFFAAMAETERENIPKSTLEGLDTAARKGKYGGWPPVITDDMLHTVLRRRALGESVE
jgi:hypothetical protein